MEAPSTRNSRQEQRCHRVVWLISRFESSGVVLLVIPREARNPPGDRGEGKRGIASGLRAGNAMGRGRGRAHEGVRDAGRWGRECRWRSVGEGIARGRRGTVRGSAGACN